MTPEEAAALEARLQAARERKAAAESAAAAEAEAARAPAPAQPPAPSRTARRVDFSKVPKATVADVGTVARKLEGQRSFAPYESEEEQQYREAGERLEIPAEREKQVQKRPLSTILGQPYAPESDVLRRQAASRGAVSTTEERDKEYLEQREGMIPFLRPTRIEEMERGPGAERVIRFAGAPLLEGESVERTPTEREELVESFARQPTLTRQAARKIVAGEEVTPEQRKLGTIEGAKIETPAEALWRALSVGTAQGIRQAYQAVAPSSPVLAAAISGVVPDVFSFRVPLAEDLPDTSFAESLRKGETIEDILLADPGVMADAEARYGKENARKQVQNTALLLEIATPLTPAGLPGVAQAGRLLGRAVQGAVGANAAARVEKEIVRRVWDAAVKETPAPKNLNADNLRQAYDAVPAERRVDPEWRLHPDAEKKIKAEAERAKPRGDLVRVSPKYAVPRSQARRAKAFADEATSAYIERARAVGAQPTPKAIANIRDQAVYDAMRGQARRLDELGQYQVILDGLGNQRAWAQTVNTLAALRDPVAATKRASIAAAEQEVARKGQGALRALKRELKDIVVTSDKPITASEALGQVAQRELGEMITKDDGAEVFAKVVEEMFGGGPVGAQWRETAVDAYRKLYPEEPLWRAIEPDRAEQLYRYLRGQVKDLPIVRPRYVQNALKIVIEEGVRKRVGKEAKAAYEARFGALDTRAPLLAAENRAFLAEEAKFAENGGEELFRLSESLPTRAGGQPIPEGAAIATVAATLRSVRTTLGYSPFSLPAVYLGERVMAPLRALAYTGVLGTPYRPALVKTPMGTFTAREIDEMIGELGGVGMTRTDVERTGRQAHDLFRAVEQEITKAQGKTAATLLRKTFYGTPAALSMAATIEEEARRAVFLRALQRGETPESAIATARRSQYDWGDSRNSEFVSRISDELVFAYRYLAVLTEQLDLVLKNPAGYRAYIRAKDKLDREYDETNQIETFDGRKVALPPIGKKQVLLDAPFAPPIGVLLRPMQAAEAVSRLPLSPELLTAALQGGADAVGELADAVGSASEALGGTGSGDVDNTLARGEPSTEQLFLSTLALAKLMDPTGRNEFVAALNYLDPAYVKPDENDVGFAGDPLAWRAPPQRVPPGSYVVSVLPEGDRDTRYYVLRPSPTGLKKLKAIRAATKAVGVDGITRAFIATEKALSGEQAEAGLWVTGAETVEDPTARAVDVTRP